MQVRKYTVKANFTVLDTLFLQGDEIYISGSIYAMDGNFSYCRKVFTVTRSFLGRISDKHFTDSIKGMLNEA